MALKEPYPMPQPPRKGTGPSNRKPRPSTPKPRKPRNLYDDDLKQTPKFPKRNPKAIIPKPAKRPKRDENQAGPRVIKPFKGPKMDRDFREMPKPVKPKARPTRPAIPVGPPTGIMGSTPNKKDNVKQRMLDDMRKRGMLSKTRKKKM